MHDDSRHYVLHCSHQSGSGQIESLIFTLMIEANSYPRMTSEIVLEKYMNSEEFYFRVEVKEANEKVLLNIKAKANHANFDCRRVLFVTFYCISSWNLSQPTQREN
jgi:hypothetical protein